MTLTIEPMKWFCALERFEINGIPADYDDFGHMEDLDPDNAPDYGCGDRGFVPSEPTREILERYGISEAEWYQVAYKLETALHFGRCALCA